MPPLSLGRSCSLKCCYFNAQSLRNKIAEFQYLINSSDFDIIFVTESWLVPSITDRMLDPRVNFNIFRQDRQTRGGGVCTLVRNTLSASLICLPNIQGLEINCVEIAAMCKLRFFLCYRPPGFTPDSVECMTKLIDCLQSNWSSSVINFVVGDLNCPNIDWGLNKAPPESPQQTLLGCFNSLGLSQYVDGPTLGKNILDVVLTDDPFVMLDLVIKPPFSTSDHDSIEFLVQFNDFTAEFAAADHSAAAAKMLPDWSRADYASIENFLAAYDWDSIFYTVFDPDDLWNAFLGVFWEAIVLFVPHIKCDRATYRKATKRRFPKHIRQLQCRKCCIWRALKSRPNELLLKMKYRNLVNKLKGQIFAFDDGNLPILPARPAIPGIDSLTISAAQVTRIIKSLKTNSSSGPDELPVVFFKSLVDVLSGPLAQLFNSFLSTGSVPNFWRTALVTPVFKKGIASEVSNYRPISITCVCSKILESHVKDSLLSYLYRNNLINPSQHGFLKRHSSSTNLLESLNDWSLAIDSSKRVGVAYIDFSRAFDSVCHSKLLHKLSWLGVGGSLLAWISSFLSNRAQRTKVGGSRSSEVRLKSGVPQGSVLGPLLFIIFVNDIAGHIGQNATTKLYADDVKMYTILDTELEIKEFQSALDRLHAWSTEWQLPISFSKCSFFAPGTGGCDIGIFFIGGKVLPATSLISDLGVLLDRKLKFDAHIHSIVKKAHTKGYMIRKCFLSSDRNLLIRAYNTYVRPALEYASSIWSPSYVGLIDEIEAVQRRFTKKLGGLENLSYSDRLDILGIKSLAYRRLYADLCMVYKIINGYVALDFSSLFSHGPSHTRGHDFKLAITPSRLNVRMHFFSQRIAPVWNQLPSGVVSAKSISAFKLRLDRVNLSEFVRSAYD